MIWDFIASIEPFFQILLAAILGSFIGLEREFRHKEAGLRTYTMVCLGSTVFTLIGFESVRAFSPTISYDPSRIIGQIVLGVGFLGAGVIIFRKDHIEGLTTAAGLWVTAAIGSAIGLQLYSLALFTAFLVVTVLAGLRLIEERLFKSKRLED
ncbi:MAG: hypothetical protein A3D59_04705 [Candidatus Wildermuthbacteria bacterium RIFCSPHIGHO2_02_FULL_47_17]|uniref:MgtC/SapB/SrpB/YhiD N-terminal domain-containing protein n=1 Tax=Candidatus Wildermuthbacteria bacterium RIFCSPHIGHO2_02_FULL_47_17 TaxID=1802452 RepID=A0A1G2R4B3_9BACT|nr:MAG: hypothetical protein A3D59_04705 [Candidatus Wildermuthbacteria bacterium RIFCSPHIGHO2_02_FULL_47_17]